jgi:DnaJ-class molecular chaperone
MANRIRCQCLGTAGCKLCDGSGYYNYEPGPMGWQFISCPTCLGTRSIPNPAAPGQTMTCFTCKGAGSVDPANPPIIGFWDKISKILFGA